MSRWPPRSATWSRDPACRSRTSHSGLAPPARACPLAAIQARSAAFERRSSTPLPVRDARFTLGVLGTNIACRQRQADGDYALDGDRETAGSRSCGGLRAAYRLPGLRCEAGSDEEPSRSSAEGSRVLPAAAGGARIERFRTQSRWKAPRRGAWRVFPAPRRQGPARAHPRPAEEVERLIQRGLNSVVENIGIVGAFLGERPMSQMAVTQPAGGRTDLAAPACRLKLYPSWSRRRVR